MRICFIGGTRYSLPLDETSAKKFRLLSQLGELYVIGFAQNPKPHRFTEHANFYLMPKLPLPVLRYFLMLTSGTLLALWFILVQKVRILVAQSPYEGFAGAAAKKLARLIGLETALIVESHGNFEESIFLQRRVLVPDIYRALMRWTSKFALKHADLLRAVSNSTHEQLQRWSPGKPIIQFPAWTDMDVFLNTQPEQAGDDVLFAGVLTPLKGVHILIDAFAKVGRKLPTAQLWIAGRDENKEYAAELREKAAALGLADRIHFTGEVSQQELARYMARCRVFVLPSFSEALPRVVFEAMAAAKPVIASNVGGIPELVQDEETGFLVPPGDIESLTKRLHWVLTHPEGAETIGKQARESARKLFSSKAYVDSYRKLFEEARKTLKNAAACN
ncbi:MAG: glycosyltransferase [Bacillota bacterium]